nr:immunoglobulin heavy chain junction region [Mus musculus]MBK4183816.1 immunoglobulin heavy chain junction region [Mus musculus]
CARRMRRILYYYVMDYW